MAEEGNRIISINIEEEMKTAYIDYSMSVIVSRALPDVRDGLKPVHRRVLYGMLDLGVRSNTAYKKSARIVGEVLGKYHPHGDTSVYDAMVRMAQSWNLRYMMVDGQGNFGSMDGDPPAAMRYTEVRLRKIAEEMLLDIEKETVDFRLNFDDTTKEPTVLPAKVPNLIINGSSGIAVGMATNMAPHNLGEAIDATIAYINDNEIDVAGLMQYIKAPDFPTGGIIYGYEGVRSAFETGRGRIVLRSKTSIEISKTGKEQIIIHEIPYQVNKADLIKRAAELVNEKIIEGISDIRDESDREGLRVVFDLKRDAIANVVLNKLFKYTELQSTFSVNNIALVKGRPQQLNMKDLISNFVEHRHEVVVRRTTYELRKAEERKHIVDGLLIALDHIDEIIKIIRASKTPDAAREELIQKYSLSDLQARAILEMRLRALTGLEYNKLKNEFDELMALIGRLNNILANEDVRMQIIRDELTEMKRLYADPRRTAIEFASGEMNMEDLIANETVVITISHAGYVKRTLLTEYKVQNRGGRGSRGAATRNEDFIEHLFVASTHNYLLLFTEKGKCFWLKVYEIPEGEKTTKGRALQNLINIEPDDKVKAFINVINLSDVEYLNSNFIMMCTKNGTIKKTTLEAYSRPRANGINAITIDEGDTLLEAILTSGTDEIMLAAKAGKVVRFNESGVRSMGRNASGVRGITLENDKDEVIGMIGIKDIATSNVLVLSEKGYGKRSDIDEYRVTKRGGKGVKTINVTDKTGTLVAIKNVNDTHDLVIINRSGITIRLAVASLRIMGRNTQGVRLINLGETDSIASITQVDHEEEVELDENGNPVFVATLDENGNPIAVAPTLDDNGNAIAVNLANLAMEDEAADTDDATEDTDEDEEEDATDAE
ncbi:MAG: DNA gyrase subunit A [Bacteroidia bacterium]|nr:DNA gyrase subunit A [Bacteroidia bacterium]